MLQEIMESLNNFFVPIYGEEKTYTIANGVISPSFGAEDGDRFYICGSRRNDGVYTYHDGVIGTDDDERIQPATPGGEEEIKAAGLRDETFAGTIRLCSVPPAVLRLSGEIKTWVENNQAALSGPFDSESFNGYSYHRGTGKNGGAMTWRDTPMGKALEIYRRPCL